MTEQIQTWANEITQLVTERNALDETVQGIKDTEDPQRVEAWAKVQHIGEKIGLIHRFAKYLISQETPEEQQRYRFGSWGNIAYLEPAKCPTGEHA